MKTSATVAMVILASALLTGCGAEAAISVEPQVEVVETISANDRSEDIVIGDVSTNDFIEEDVSGENTTVESVSTNDTTGKESTEVVVVEVMPTPTPKPEATPTPVPVEPGVTVIECNVQNTDELNTVYPRETYVSGREEWIDPYGVIYYRNEDTFGYWEVDYDNTPKAAMNAAIAAERAQAQAEADAAEAEATANREENGQRSFIEGNGWEVGGTYEYISGSRTVTGNVYTRLVYYVVDEKTLELISSEPYYP